MSNREIAQRLHRNKWLAIECKDSACPGCEPIVAALEAKDAECNAALKRAIDLERAIQVKIDEDHRAAHEETRRQLERMRGLLLVAEVWMGEEGCDCGTDEPGSCGLCQIQAALEESR